MKGLHPARNSFTSAAGSDPLWQPPTRAWPKCSGGATRVAIDRPLAQGRGRPPRALSPTHPIHLGSRACLLSLMRPRPISARQNPVRTPEPGGRPTCPRFKSNLPLARFSHPNLTCHETQSAPNKPYTDANRHGKLKTVYCTLMYYFFQKSTILKTFLHLKIPFVLSQNVI
jgi:hypothetical protein